MVLVVELRGRRIDRGVVVVVVVVGGDRESSAKWQSGKCNKCEGWFGRGNAIACEL